MMKRPKQYNHNRKNDARREKIIMIASSAFVLTALTMTGVYVKNSSEQNKHDGYHIDFSALEQELEEISVPDKIDEIQGQNSVPAPVTEDDLDYLPMEQVDSGDIEIPGLTDSPVQEESESVSPENEAAGPTAEADGQKEQFLGGTGPDAAAEESKRQEEDAKDQAAIDADAGIGISIQPEPDFSAGDRLVWPVAGNVLIPYSMDKTVYFSTLQQYRYNPGLVISAAEGDAITAAAAGRVTDIYTDARIGNAVKVNIGGGYEIIYGQLKDIEVTEGTYIERGSIVGYVAEPTIYYSVEGANVFFELLLYGLPVDPMGELQ